MAMRFETIEKLRQFRNDMNQSAEAAKQNEETAVNTDSLNEVSQNAEEDNAKKNRAKLVVLEGGLRGVEQAKIPSISDMPTPGGITLLLFLTVFILFSFVQVRDPDGNPTGYTRLQLIWQAIIGNATFGGVTTGVPQSAPTEPFIPGSVGMSPPMPGGVPYNWQIGP